MFFIVGLLGIILMLGIGASIFFSKRQERRQRFLFVIAPGKGNVASGSGKEKSLAKQRAADIAKKLKEASDESQGKKKDKTSIRELMQQAGIEAPLSRYWAFSAGFAAFAAVFIFLTSWPIIAKIFAVITAFLGVPKLFLKWKGARRQRQFLESFSDALDGMARLLQSGLPMTEAIAMGAREFEGPIQEEMLRIYDNQKIGVPLGDAALLMAKRIPLPEVNMFATALLIQSETGSSLSEVLMNLSTVIRARFRLKRKVKALSSEAKSSAAIIGALPLLVTGGLYLARPDYIGVLFTHPTGKILLTCAGIWMSFGVLMMRQMINFKV